MYTHFLQSQSCQVSLRDNRDMLDVDYVASTAPQILFEEYGFFKADSGRGCCVYHLFLSVTLKTIGENVQHEMNGKNVLFCCFVVAPLPRLSIQNRSKWHHNLSPRGGLLWSALSQTGRRGGFWKSVYRHGKFPTFSSLLDVIRQWDS